MLAGVTKSGFHYEITDDRLNNMELVDALSEFDETENDGDKAIVLSRVCRLMLGSKQKTALYNHLREPEGNVPIDKVLAEVMDIITNESVKN